MIGKDRRCQSYPSYLNYLSDQSDRSDRWYQRVNGRTDRASLQVATRLALTGTDALTFDTTDALPLDTSRASLHRLHVEASLQVSL